MKASMTSEKKQAVQLTLKVVPGSSRTEVVGRYDGMLKVKIAAPPEQGKANKMLIAFLAKALGIRKNEIHITSGQTSSIKQIRCEGVTQDDVEKLCP